ncbi:MAG: DNA replication and repair protein RecF [Victivallales bacterium]|nr:DNA replication and repair protein RecF [Victivallales bacterium]
MLSRLQITRFRNFDQAEVSLAPGFNCLVGRNGQGKTNLLEAVYYLSLLRSFRTSEINDLRQWKAALFSLKATIVDSSGLETELFVGYGTERRLKINETPVYRASDFINQFLCVSFIPDDLRLVQGAPQLRRRFLDIAASQASPEYLRHLQAYQEGLHSRNVMLRNQQKYPRAMITAYDKSIAREGAFLEYARRDFVCQLNGILSEQSPILLQDDRRISLKYLSRINGILLQESNGTQEELEQLLLKTLTENYQRDCVQGYTTAGPHRADFSCLLGNVSMQRYSSQGECRLASLALRLACLRLLAEKRGSGSITLLIDDVIGELDFQRRTAFFNMISGLGQCLFACTELPPSLPRPDRVIKVSAGSLMVSESL